MIGIETELNQRFAHRDFRAVFGGQHAFVEGAGYRAAAEQGRRKPYPLLVGKTGHFDGKGKPLSAFVEVGDTGDRRDQAERAVPSAGIAHRVVVRTQHQARQARPVAFVTPADIADGIEMGAHARFNHPGHDQIGRRAMFHREKDARQVIRRLRNRRQPIDPADDFVAKRQGVSSSGGCVLLAHVFPTMETEKLPDLTRVGR